MTVDELAQIIRESDDAYVRVLRRHLINPTQPDPTGLAQSIYQRTTGGMTAAQYEAWLPEAAIRSGELKPAPPAGTIIRKARDQVKAVSSNYCNLFDSRGQQQFSPFIGGMPFARQDEWMANEQAHGSTHLAVSVDINGYASLHDVELSTFNFYLTDRWHDFDSLLRRLLERGLTPIVFLHCGDFYAGDDYYRGICRWWNAHWADFTDQVIFVNGWETRRRNSGHRAAEYDRCTKIMRQELGPSAIFGAHLTQGDGIFGSHAPVEDDDPWKDNEEQDNWYTHSGLEFEVLLFQTLQPTDDRDLDEFGQPKWWNRAIDTGERFLPQGTPLPGSVGLKEGQHDGGWHYRAGYAYKDWFGRKRERGRPVMVAFEYVAWEHMNKGGVSPERVKAVAQKLRSFGFQHFGNGLP